MSLPKTIVFCEGSSDERIIKQILLSLNSPREISVEVMQRPLSPQTLLTKLSDYDGKDKNGGTLGRIRRTAEKFNEAIIIFDLEFGSPLDQAPEMSKLDNIWLCPAVPTVDTWIISDPNVFTNLYRDLPGEGSSYEKFILNKSTHFMSASAKKKMFSREIRGIYSHSRAASVSPSLRSFIRLIENSGKSLKPEHFSLPSSVLSALVSEYYPEKSPIFRTLSGSVITGLEMRKEIEEGSDIGRSYTSELLRVCRDLLARQASKYKAQK